MSEDFASDVPPENTPGWEVEELPDIYLDFVPCECGGRVEEDDDVHDQFKPPSAGGTA